MNNIINITKCLSLLAALLLTFGCEKDIIEKVPNSETHSISSLNMQKDYTIYVLYPDDYDGNKAYLTLVLLDANDYYVEMADVLQNDSPNQFVLVGVKYNDFSERQDDFTYPAMSEVANSGHADSYIRFLAEELLPFLQNELSIESSEKTLLGHSLAGYLGTYLLLQQAYENPFDNIISASPSLWWGDGYIFGLEDAFAASHASLSAKYYITMGDLEGALMNTHFNAFTKRIASRNYPQSDFQVKRYKNISHRNSPIISFKDGINFIK